MSLLNLKPDFPLLERFPHLSYLDSAATTQKPQVVIEALNNYYSENNANVHRGIYRLAELATASFEAARERARVFVGAKEAKEIIFTRGTTEAINLVAQSFLQPRLAKGDKIVLTVMEHHSNILPWQSLAKTAGAELVVVGIDQSGTLMMDELAGALDNRVKLIACTHISNTLGTKNPIEEVCQLASLAGVPILIDAAQSALSEDLRVDKWNCDFLVFSGHKMLGPMGIGILYGKSSHLEEMPPWQQGGEMIKSVSFRETVFADIPHKFEAGTPNVGGAIALHSAMDFIDQVGKEQIRKHLETIRSYANAVLSEIEGLRVVGNAMQKSAIFSLILEGIHPHDLATILNESKIAVRAGHHCTEPLMDYLDIPGTCRASFSIYNDLSDVDRLADGLLTAKKIFSL